ncbi:hypothetical protein [Bacillus sp. FDAARGOS_235]|nr:hypothetical protein [Bacillus sp. FDAARGOS_235]
MTGKRAYPQPGGTGKSAIHYYSVKDWANYIFDGYQQINDKRYYFTNDG